MMDKATRQRRATHRRRKAFARTLHQVLAFRRPWMAARGRFRRNMGLQPPRIKLPHSMRKHKAKLYRAFTGGLAGAPQ